MGENGNSIHGARCARNHDATASIYDGYAVKSFFLYKLSAEDNDKSAYEGNQIAVNEFHKKTIINLIDLILQRNY